MKRRITHLAVCSHHDGAMVSEEMSGLLIGIAYITDQSALEDNARPRGNRETPATT